VVHRGETVGEEVAKQSIEIADMLLNVVFPDVLSKLDLHTHPPIRICNKAHQKPPVINAAKLSILLRPGAGLGITRDEADLGGIWLPGGVGAAGAFPRRWEALRHFGVRALVFGPTPISQSSLVAGVTESIAGSPSSPTEGLKIGRVSR